MVKALLEMNKGEKGKILSIKGGKGRILRLAELGIIPGEEIILMQKSFGPIIVKVKDTNLALGRVIAQNIIVEVENGKKED
ncbi:MAG: ferrous iron transport protein A [Dictyoglomus sp.]|nr:ferrous iron transport protein A [Dictyoglomus sp.]MCX7942332.1 ferrous iron transport protein A [Dictyoglomaceae bacterium]MDW8188635.1 FeoA family protein [Dictyoglomus sp.]